MSRASSTTGVDPSYAARRVKTIVEQGWRERLSPLPVWPVSGTDPRRSAGKMGRGLSPEPCASADAEALLDGPVFLAVLLRCPDECPSDDRKRKDAYGGDHCPEEGAHYDSSRVNTGEVGGLADALDDLDQFLGAVALLLGEAD